MKHGVSIPMTDHQRGELRTFITKHLKDEEVAREYGEPGIPIVGIHPFPCKVPGLLRVVTDHDITLTVLYPEPRPIPCDPLFQHAEPLSHDSHLMGVRFLAGRLEWARDWQWDSAKMDAPNEMPAGACYGFDYDDDVYGARQRTFFRE